jgi:hypothetical protein
MSDGWAALGNVLGGGIDREGAYQSGLKEGAQAQSALAQARVRQMDARRKVDEEEARKGLAEAFAGMGMPATEAEAAATIARAGMGNFQQLQTGRQTGQNMGFQREMVDPNTDMEGLQRRRAAMGHSAFNPVSVQGGLAFDLMSADPYGSRQVTPGEQASIGQRNAAASLSRAREEWGPQGRQAATSAADTLIPREEFRSVVPEHLNFDSPTGPRGAFEQGVNVVGNVFGRLPFKDTAEERQVLSDVAQRTRSAGRILLNMTGRPSNLQLEMAGVFAVDPTDILRGDQLAVARLQQTRDTIARAMDIRENQLRRPNMTPSRQDRLIEERDDLAALIADYDAILSRFARPEARGQVQRPGGLAEDVTAPAGGLPPGWSVEIEP